MRHGALNSLVTFGLVFGLSIVSAEAYGGSKPINPNELKGVNGVVYQPQFVLSGCSPANPAGYLTTAINLDVSCYTGPGSTNTRYTFTSYIDKPIGATMVICGYATPNGWIVVNTIDDYIGPCSYDGRWHATDYVIQRVF